MGSQALTRPARCSSRSSQRRRYTETHSIPGRSSLDDTARAAPIQNAQSAGRERTNNTQLDSLNSLQGSLTSDNTCAVKKVP